MDSPRIIDMAAKKMIGLCATMSYTVHPVAELWRRFRPREKEISSRTDQHLLSLTLYTGLLPDDPLYSPDVEFVKWAGVEVNSLEEIPAGMQGLIIPSGRYAVFIHKGRAAEFYRTWSYIYQNWMPGSGYQCDRRPFFEVLTQDYNPADVNAREEVWIPIAKIAT